MANNSGVAFSLLFSICGLDCCLFYGGDSDIVFHCLLLFPLCCVFVLGPCLFLNLEISARKSGNIKFLTIIIIIN